ncbi:alpha/beta hydrolase [bacterium]|nr:alpha/beta hydrolase [bacterium]
MELYKTILPGGAELTGYLRDNCPEMPTVAVRPAMLIFPGGGYEYCSKRESDPVAMQFLAAGYQVFTLIYTTKRPPLGWQPLTEAAWAVAHIRQNAAALRVDPEKIAVCGFSAGGHLAGSVAALWDAEPVQAALGRPGRAARPDAAVLCYPVITSGSLAHRGSFDQLCGQDAAMLAQFSLECHARPDMPPCFLWHNATDESVPVQNSLLMAGALQQAQAPYELHIFNKGVHGESICTPEVNTPNAHSAHWLPLCLEWLEDVL